MSNNNDTKRSRIQFYSALKSTEIANPTFIIHLMSCERVAFLRAQQSQSIDEFVKLMHFISNQPPKEEILRGRHVRVSEKYRGSAPSPREFCEIYMLAFTIYACRKKGPVVNCSTGRSKTNYA